MFRSGFGAEIGDQSFIRFNRKFVSEVLLGFGEIKLVDQVEFPTAALIDLSDEKRVQGTRPWIRQERALPLILLVDDEVKMVEVVFGSACFFPYLFWQQTVKFSGKNQFHLVLALSALNPLAQ